MRKPRCSLAKYPAVQESIAIAEGIVAGRFVAADFGALLTAARASAATLATTVRKSLNRFYCIVCGAIMMPLP
jgi:hypothetical protein